MTAPAAGDEAGRAAFVFANTRLHPVPLCPAIRLRLADEAVALWQLTEAELGERGLPMPFWAFAWAGGQALARHLLDSPGTVAGRSVVDLGSGSGLVAIAAAMAGARRVTAADVDPWAVAAIGINASLNDVHVEAVEADLLDGAAPDAELLLVGDLFYDREVAPRLLAFLDRARAAGSTVLIGDPGRSYLPTPRLSRLAEYGVPTTRELEDAEIKRTVVWQLGEAA